MLILLQFIKFWADLPIQMISTHLSSKNMTSLCGSSFLPCPLNLITNQISSYLISISLDISSKIYLICIYKFSSISTVGSSYSVGCIRSLTILTSTLWLTLTYVLNFTLWWYSWYFIIIFARHIRHILLHWSQHWHVVLLRLIIYLFHKICYCCWTKF